MGWWGFTFPLGVYAVSTITSGVEMPSQFFKIFGTVSTPFPTRSVRSLNSLVQILSIAVIILWIVVALGTAKGACSGKLFYAPCVANLKPKQANERPSIDSEKVSQDKWLTAER